MANPCCGTECAKCGGCKEQHWKKENREYLGCVGGFIPTNN